MSWTVQEHPRVEVDPIGVTNEKYTLKRCSIGDRLVTVWGPHPNGEEAEQELICILEQFEDYFKGKFKQESLNQMKLEGMEGQNLTSFAAKARTRRKK